MDLVAIIGALLESQRVSYMIHKEHILVLPTELCMYIQFKQMDGYEKHFQPCDIKHLWHFNVGNGLMRFSLHLNE